MKVIAGASGCNSGASTPALRGSPTAASGTLSKAIDTLSDVGDVPASNESALGKDLS